MIARQARPQRIGACGVTSTSVLIFCRRIRPHSNCSPSETTSNGRLRRKEFRSNEINGRRGFTHSICTVGTLRKTISWSCSTNRTIIVHLQVGSPTADRLATSFRRRQRFCGDLFCGDRIDSLTMRPLATVLGGASTRFSVKFVSSA